MTPPLAVAAIVLCVAGIAKLRSPSVAVQALRTLGLPGPPMLVRGLGLVEIMVGVWALAGPRLVPTVLLAATYGGFAVVALLLTRRRSSCGCFGESDSPASTAQSVLSACFALVAVAAAIWQAHGVSWLTARSAPTAAAMILGIAGAAYATVLAYTELPLVWSAWAGGSR